VPGLFYFIVDSIKPDLAAHSFKAEHIFSPHSESETT